MIEEARSARTEALTARSGKARRATQAALAQNGSHTQRQDVGSHAEEQEEEEGNDAMALGDSFARMSIQVGMG